MSFRDTRNIQKKYNYYSSINDNKYSENINPSNIKINSTINYSKKNYIDNISFKPNQSINSLYTDNNDMNYYDYEEEEKNNFNINDNYNENKFNRNNENDYGKQYNLSNKVMNDFKKIMEQTKIIQNKILLKSKDIKNNIFNNSYFNKENSTQSFDKTNAKNNKKNNFSEDEEDITNYLTMDTNFNFMNTTNKINYKNNNKNTDENIKEKLKKKNQMLSDINSKISLKNNLLELEISNYESKQNNQDNFLQNNIINNNTFYLSLKKFMYNLKNSFKNNIESNKALSQKIFGELIENQKINENNNKNRIIYEKLKLRYEKENKRISEIQKYNLENNKRYLYLKDEKNLLNKTYEKHKLILSKLKSNEKNLVFKKNETKKNINNNQELIQAFKYCYLYRRRLCPQKGKQR